MLIQLAEYSNSDTGVIGSSPIHVFILISSKVEQNTSNILILVRV